ncbi:hypothetical protein OH76DRAFT_1479432 [Lentinus brumalis]|uniref:Uncharacterized protein n=1 Tax=Lentinus brumalis TaxID=2498619 RepID=A0A371DM71_9APHY|nr:hypothetical protein OH76DRAFT_1479432 [Polyporus brumalis]
MNIAALVHAKDQPVFVTRNHWGSASTGMSSFPHGRDDVVESGTARTALWHTEDDLHGLRPHGAETSSQVAAPSESRCVFSTNNTTTDGGVSRSRSSSPGSFESQAHQSTSTEFLGWLDPPSLDVGHGPFRGLHAGTHVGEVVLGNRRAPSPVALPAPLSDLDVWYDIVDLFVGLRTPPPVVVYRALGIDPTVQGHGLHALQDTRDGSGPPPMAAILQLALVDTIHRCMSGRDLAATLRDHFQCFQREPQGRWRSTMFDVLEEQWYFKSVPCQADLASEEKLWFVDFAAGIPLSLLRDMPRRTRPSRPEPDRACETITADGPRCMLKFSRWDYTVY